MSHKLQYISQGNTSQEHINNIQEVLEGGCSWVQLRMKNFSSEEIEKTAKEVRILCNQYNAVFIMNDNVSLAKTCDTDGVHLGLSDMSITKAREILGEDKIIGGTANSLTDVQNRIKEKCNYIGLGPFRFTDTKENLSPILGLEGYLEIISQLNEIQLQTPIYAIGGISFNDVDSILQANIYGIAVSGILTNTPDKKLIIEQFNSQLYATT